MSSLRLAGLTAKNFRGIAGALNIRFGRRLTIIYGGNASGKSSIAQAIEFGLSGQVLDQDDRPLRPDHITHGLGGEHGQVELDLVSDSQQFTLVAHTNDSQKTVENRFRALANIEWPEKLPLPINQTHVTSQGLLTRVLSADSSSRNDLSSLCSGAQLRAILARVDALADNLRQAATGRNIQADIRAARAALESANVLSQRLTMTSGPILSMSDLNERLSQFVKDAGLNADTDLTMAIQSVERRLAEISSKYSTVQKLGERMKDVGLYEEECKQARAVVDQAIRDERVSSENREEAKKRLEDVETELKKAVVENEAASSVVAQYHHFENWKSVAASVRTQLDRTRQDLQPAVTQLDGLTQQLTQARDEQASASAKYSELASEAAKLSRLITSLEATLNQLSRVPASQIASLEQQQERIGSRLGLLRDNGGNASTDLSTAVMNESAAQAKVREYSEGDAKYAAAANELRSAITDETCTLCGHNHGTRGQLEKAIEEVISRRLSTSRQLLRNYEDSSAKRRHAAEVVQRLNEEIEAAEREFNENARTLMNRQADRAGVIKSAREVISSYGLRTEISEQALNSLLGSLRNEMLDLGPSIEYANSQMEEAVQRLADLETELTIRHASVDQMRRLIADIEVRLDSHERAMPAEVTAEQLSIAQVMVQGAERRILQARQIEGGLRAEVAQHERSLSETRSRKAGATGRLQSAEAVLGSFDSELMAVGAVRSVESILSVEAATRLERDRVEALSKRGSAIRDGFILAEREKVRTEAESQLQAAQGTLERLQAQQELLSNRATRIAALRRSLQDAQKSASETVLRSIQKPVGILFRAMTAGCAWDIDMSLDDGGRIQAQISDEGLGEVPATSLLNSAFYNVAAVALRIALAGQQTWTNLRTVVLDDPILEMDLLTQSSLLDGFDAVLSSPVAPWDSLQLVITTWSEDFAVLAAHKLAHLNQSDSAVPDNFYIYRLNTSPSGEPLLEWHTPRWDKAVTAA